MIADLAALLEATWPPAQSHQLGPFMLRAGQGGGKRVSAASLAAPRFAMADIEAAESGMRALGQVPLFVIWPGPADQALDAALQARGYDLVDPVIGYQADVDHLLRGGGEAAGAYPHWPPLAIARDLWQAMGIGPARLQVMARVTAPKTVILARAGDAPAGVCFAAVANGYAMIHALEVAPAHRRKGLARQIITRAAHWAQGEGKGARQLALVVTRGNAPARALYEGIGMVQTHAYHYRQQRDATIPEERC